MLCGLPPFVFWVVLFFGPVIAFVSWGRRVYHWVFWIFFPPFYYASGIGFELFGSPACVLYKGAACGFVEFGVLYGRYANDCRDAISGKGPLGGGYVW